MTAGGSREVRPARRLRGTIAVPGDKSISHRAAILNALADGDAVVANFLAGDDPRSTLGVLRALGVRAELEGRELRVRGVGLRGLREAEDVLDCGNAGTTMRLMAGVLAGQDALSVLSGDASLRSRPMARIVAPLRQMGARVDGRAGGSLAPLTIRGGALRGIRHRTAVASAQVKSCVLVAGLYADGETTVEEPALTRDHTERMLDAMGATLRREGTAVRIAPAARLAPLSMRVPNDFSAAAFWIVAASVHPDAEVRLEGVGLNPTRTGLLDVLQEMGGDIAIEEERTVGGEPVGDLVVRSSRLEGVRVEGGTLLRLIDEAPVLAVAAALATGVTEIADAAELRAKESDRISTVAAALNALGGRVEERADGMTIEGGALGGGRASAAGDHRLAMALGVAGLASERGVVIDGADVATVSYPGFWEDLESLSR